jgi:hypothetical protein
MRLLYINDILVDIDEKTAIGIDLQTYDIKEPSKPKVSVSNSFTIPITNKNLKAIGYIGGMHNISNVIYEQSVCNYYINNIQYIRDAKLRVQSISDRIEVFIFQKADVWDLLKKVKWGDFVSDYYDWLNIPKIGSEDGVSTWQEFIDEYTPSGGYNNLFIPYFKNNEEYTSANMQLSGSGDSGGGMCSFVKSVFQYIEETYTVEFYTQTSFTGNIWDDPIGSSMYWEYRDIYPRLF